jgi:hypothetical protein
MSELKPCPFCGGEPERRKILGVHHIACKSCGSASSGDKYLPGTEHTWNTRPVPKLPDGYRVEGGKLYFQNELIAEYDPEFIPNVGLIFYGGYEIGEACMDVKHASALAVFLQGAR